MTQAIEQLADSIASRLVERGWTAAVAESLTAGSLACALGAAHDASRWFRGGVTAYAPEVKFAVLGVEPGPVVTAACAEHMARGVADLMRADVSVATTGAGGPGPAEGKPAGTVFIAVCAKSRVRVTEHHFGGAAAAVVEKATLAALIALSAAID